MRGHALADPVLHITKAIDNSRVVREVDPRSSRDLWLLLLLVGTLAGGMVLYAWPHFELRQLGLERQQMQQDRERLIEENRKLRLEKATLENLRRIETIAVRDLGLRPPRPQQLLVVEKPDELPEGTQLASSQPTGVERR
jgi:cell division protein FtsL